MSQTDSQRIVLGVAYDGSALRGWQRQPAQPTVQGHLESAIGRIADHAITVKAAGRTDSGVHATAQVLHFDTDAERPGKAWVLGVNSHLPAAIRVRWARRVDSAFHARFSATMRRYMFVYLDESAASPLLRDQVWPGPRLNELRMHEAAQHFLGERDFSAVRAAGCQSPNAWRCVQRIAVNRYGPVVVLDVQANAFLLHMVRNMARALADVGSEKRTAGWIIELLASRDRATLGPTAPPGGLYLVQVGYPPGAAGQPFDSGGQPPPVLRVLGDLERF